MQDAADTKMRFKSSASRELHKVRRHHQNPYESGQKGQVMSSYHPGEYYLTLILSLPAPALRVLSVAMAKLERDGTVKLPLQDVKRLAPHPLPTLSTAVKTLIEKDILQKSGERSRYWLNPAICSPLVIGQ